MKTTVRLGSYHRMTVEPHREGVAVTMETKSLFMEQWHPVMHQTLTPDQAGALIFGMEQALDVQTITL